MTPKDYDILIPFWKVNYFVKEMDSFERFKLFLEKNPGLSIIAEDNGNIIGTALGSFDGRRGYIQKVVVRKDFRRKGFGQQLVQKVIEKLQAVGVTYISISIEDNLISFYEKCGFKRSQQTTMNKNL